MFCPPPPPQTNASTTLSYPTALPCHFIPSTYCCRVATSARDKKGGYTPKCGVLPQRIPPCCSGGHVQRYRRPRGGCKSGFPMHRLQAFRGKRLSLLLALPVLELEELLVSWHRKWHRISPANRGGGCDVHTRGSRISRERGRDFWGYTDQKNQRRTVIENNSPVVGNARFKPYLWTSNFISLLFHKAGFIKRGITEPLKFQEFARRHSFQASMLHMCLKVN